MAKLGDWRWYIGSDERDDEMMDCGSKTAAIEQGRAEYSLGQSFYIVEARMRLSDEVAMAAGRKDTAPFAETRNGEWIRA